MNKAEQLRKALISVLTSKNDIVDLDTIKGIDDSDDLERLTVNLEAYIKKYPSCGLRLDYNTSRLHKKKKISLSFHPISIICLHQDLKSIQHY